MSNNAEMYVPVSLDGHMVQILNSKGKSKGHRNQPAGDFSVYANAFEKKLTADKMNFSR